MVEGRQLVDQYAGKLVQSRELVFWKLLRVIEEFVMEFLEEFEQVRL